MNNSINEQIGFTIVSYDIDNDSIIVRPYSSQFKKAEDSYPVYNISISSLDFSKDLTPQIVKAISFITDRIIANESLVVTDDAKSVLGNLMGRRVTMAKEELTKITNSDIVPSQKEPPFSQQPPSENISSIDFVA